MTETQLLLVKFLVSMCSYNQILIVHHVCAFLKTFDLYFSIWLDGGFGGRGRNRLGIVLGGVTPPLLLPLHRNECPPTRTLVRTLIYFASSVYSVHFSNGRRG